MLSETAQVCGQLASSGATTVQFFEITYIFVIKSELIRLHYINVVDGNYVMLFCDV